MIDSQANSIMQLLIFGVELRLACRIVCGV
jgi:hypothetical protein